MEFIKQDLGELLEALGPLTVDWRDDVARRVIERIEGFPIKSTYTEQDIHGLFSGDFDDGKLVARLFLGLSKDAFDGVISEALGPGGTGVKRYQKDPDGYVAALMALGLLDAMSEHTHRQPKWSDILVERLRSGRGSAISGQKRGRGVEDFAEEVVARVFGNNYEARCSFTGRRGKNAKCDLAIPSKDNPRIIIEAKGYGATGSKMSDVVGDLDAIIDAKRPNCTLLFFTDGLTWRQRQSDLRKIVDRQNNGEIDRIYTASMSGQLEGDLVTLKTEYRL